jgi:ankyrin repeat protein
MGSEAILKAPYRAAMKGKWDLMIDYYQKHSEYLHSPLTASKETALHIAVCSKQEQPLKDLLEIMTTSELPLTETEFLKKKNKFGNTVLHEATIYGNNKAVKLLVERCPELLSVPNDFGETPLFTAAGFAETEIVKFLIRSKRGQCEDDDGLLLPIHRQRTVDNLSILSAAIIGQNFGNNFSLY